MSALCARVYAVLRIAAGYYFLIIEAMCVLWYGARRQQRVRLAQVGGILSFAEPADDSREPFVGGGQFAAQMADVHAQAVMTPYATG